MRPTLLLLATLGMSVTLGLVACGGSNGPSGFGGSSSSSGGNSGSGSGGSGGGLLGDGGTGSGSGGGGTAVTIVYAHTDTTLYSVDPASNAVTMIGDFTGGASVITDLAVNASGDVYVNSESAVFKAALPSGGSGPVALTQVASISGAGSMYALAFTPVGSLDPSNEVLVGGDGTGTVWSIDTTSGATKNLGNFGPDPSNSCSSGYGCVLGLSGDMVFYLDGNDAPTGLATIRSCSSSGSGCSTDWLAGVDMDALKTAYTTGTPATTGHALLKGIYGGSGNSLGSGTGYHSVYGLAAYDSKIFGFTRSSSKGSPPSLVTIDTTSGAGTLVSSGFSFSNGWSGAGVTTKVSVMAPPPPPPPNQ